MARQTQSNPPDQLTEREREVLDLLRSGLGNSEIAERLGISLDGAKYHVSEIIGKLGVRSRHEAAYWPERPPWWLRAVAPFGGVWQKASASWVSGAVAGGLAIALVAGIGLLVWGLARTDRDGAPEEGANANYLLASNPTGPSICVDGAAGYHIDAAELEAVQSALQRGLDAAPDAPTELRELLVSTGCPAPPAALTDSTIEPANRFMSVGRRVETLSGHRLFVYFMPPDVYTASFGGEPFTRAWSEVICTGDTCQFQSRSVYAPESITPETLQRALMEALGVIERAPRTPVPCEEEGGPGLLRTCDVIVDDIGDIAP